jgi:DNA-binding protein H-NS
MAKSPSQKITLEDVLSVIDSFEIEELAQVKEATTDKIESMKHLVISQFKSDLQRKMTLFGLTAADLGLGAPLPATRGRKAKAAMDGDVVPKYVHPSDPTLTWQGKGRPARWLQELLDQGEDKAKFLNPAYSK